MVNMDLDEFHAKFRFRFKCLLLSTIAYCLVTYLFVGNINPLSGTISTGKKLICLPWNHLTHKKQRPESYVTVSRNVVGPTARVCK